MSIAVLGLTIAAISLVASAGKIVFDIRVAPRREQAQSKRIRAEIRREGVASDLRQLLGLRGSQLIEEVESAWHQRDLAALREDVHDVAQVASKAYRIAETINDVVEIHVGVIMVEAQELVERLDMWLTTDTTTDDFGQFRDSIDLITERVTAVQDWSHTVLGDPIPTDE